MKKQLRIGWQIAIFAALILTLTLNWDQIPSSLMASQIMEEPRAEVVEAGEMAEVKTVAKVDENPQYLDIALSPELQDYTRVVCDKCDVPFELALAVMQVESSFRVDAVNDQSYGLMQIHKINWARLSSKLGIDDFMEPKNNIMAGVHMLSELISKYGEYEAVLVCYNRGEAGAQKCWDKEIYSTAYSRKVLKIYSDFLKQEANKTKTAMAS